MIADVALLVNPTSGGGRAVTTARRVADYLRGSGVAVEELSGRDETEALDLARCAVERGTGALVACGGDGIVNVALQVVAGTSTPFGVIPAGTGNDHARMLDIPRGDPMAAAQVVLEGAVRPVDLGRTTGRDGQRWFGTVLAGGFDAKVTDRTNRLSWPRGKMRYNLAILVELAALKPMEYVIEVDGQQWETSAMLVAVGNGQSYGGGMRICPSAVDDDGQFDITVIGEISVGRLVRVFPTIYKGRHVDYPKVNTYRARSVTLSTPGVTAYADGERFTPLPVTCECVPRAALALAPR